MFGMGIGELLVILVVALIFVGPDKLPEAAHAIGKAIRTLRRETDELRETLDRDDSIGGTVRELRSALAGDWDPSRVDAAPPEPPDPTAPAEPAQVAEPAPLAGATPPDRATPATPARDVDAPSAGERTEPPRS